MRPHSWKRLRNRLARIEGQVRGISRMIDEDAYCIDVLQQLNSISSAIDGVRLQLLDDHVRACLANAISKGQSEQTMEELMEAVRRVAKA